MSFGPSQIPESTSIFTEACEQFRSSLSEKQRSYFKEYPDANSMLQSLLEEIEKHPVQTSLLTRCCHKISNLSTKLSPFFKIFDLFVSSKPEVAAIVWGSIRLIFVLGTNHVDFLERVCELFDEMSMRLPIYEKYFETISFTLRQRGSPNPSRLVTAMAYVYADLLQFCFDISQLFSRKRSVFMSLRGSFMPLLSKTLLNPFHLRYSTLMRRWDQHQRILDLELRLWTDHEQMGAAQRIEDMLRDFVRVGAFEDTTSSEYQQNQDPGWLKHRLHKWISPPPWLDLFEATQRRKQSGSTQWFFRQDQVAQWISEALKSHRPTLPVLSVQAKPGYGKTTLCTTLIEHLQIQAPAFRTNSSNGRKQALAFFYFDKQRQDSVSSGAAWRAILAQLLHAVSTFDSDILDILLLFQESRLSGHSAASENDVFSLLNLLIQRLDRLFLVIDGVDECSHPLDFLNRLSALLNSQRNSVAALFNRPTVTVPARLMKDTLIWPLTSELNRLGIEMFLRPKIMDLVHDGFLSPSSNPEEITCQVAGRANGMFLWATLFISYLQSPHISFRERHEAIRNLNRLESLDFLYRAILDSLEQSNIGNARENSTQAFKLVTHSFRPFHVTELQYAIAVPADRGVDSEDLIPNFSRNIGLLSGALMEVDQNGFVRFVHLSVIEYLSAVTTRSSGASSPGDFSIDRHSSHRSLACRCLSYLRYSVKGEPLSGSSQCPPDLDAQIRRYPLLDYATEFWSFHVLDCLESVALHALGPDSKSLIELASEFLSNQSSVMAWIEASWMFGRPPQIRNGPLDVFFRRGCRVPPLSDPRLKAAWERAWLTLSQLSQDLAALDKSWSHILKDDPNEIWEPSISAFSQSPFWRRISGSRIIATFQPSSDNRNSICLKTQPSLDGSQMGLIRLYLPRLREEAMHSATVVFEQWSIQPNKKLREVNLNIARSCMKPFLHGVRLDGFQFPTAMTANFGRVAAPGCVVGIPTLGDEEQGFTIDDVTQFIDFTGNSWRNSPFKFAIEDFQLGYDIQISASGEYLITIHKSVGLVEVTKVMSLHLRLINVYRDAAFSTSSRPSYQHITSLAFKPMYVHAHDHDASWCALLHPRYPMVAFRFAECIVVRDSRGESQVIERDGINGGLWDFKMQGRRALRYSTECPERLQFDHDGEYFAEIALGNCDQKGKSSQVRVIPDVDEARNQGNEMTLHRPSALPFHLPYRKGQPSVRAMGEVFSTVDASGAASISQLGNTGNAEVVLTTLREDGLMTAETVTRLPRNMARDYKASLLSTNEEGPPQQRWIFLDREDQPFRYHRLENDEVSGVQFPIVLDRQQSTIPTAIGRGSYTLEEGFQVTDHPRKRLGWFEDDHQAKRREWRN
ncbi:hypothetical protein B0T10DRAFT_51746 [Thelonectria olida]|uniref:NACHT domain-containing protein n=1 Tax=Thelonectria olida TaxID=1576542 RepID=A0A9P8W4I2_9HYPO|nr:hypothetical protein B0T10DRAFT_51746 [Thelonectria olida]